ncbi:MAG TPA: hypothetical protein VMZ00_04760 [Sporichthya sp.]|nr:hypothetical protein [Sporichthya sp.]
MAVRNWWGVGMNLSWRRIVVIGSLLAITVAGCGDGNKATDPLDPELSAAPTPTGYSAAVNARCGELEKATFDITGGAEPTIAVFQKNLAKLDALTAGFDADVAKIPVTTSADREAAKAFKAFQRFSDAEWAKLKAAAAAGDEAKFQTAFQKFLDTFADSTVPAALANVEIACPAR